MAINSEQVARLLSMLKHTRDVELTCPECLDELDKYTQSILDAAPVDTVPIDEVLTRVREHLEACPCCNDQFKLVLETLKAIEQ